MSLKHQNIILFTGLIILLWIAYQFAIANTLEAKNRYNTLLKHKELTSNIPQQINYLKQQNRYFDSVLKKNKINSESSFQNNLLQIINSFTDKNGLTIISFNEPHLTVRNETLLKTYIFTVKGNFKQILELIYALEQIGTYGKISSIDFNKKKNYKRDLIFLECEIFLQRIEDIRK